MTEYIYNYGTQNTGKKFRRPNLILNFFPAAQNHIIQHHHHFMYEMLYEIHTLSSWINFKEGERKKSSKSVRPVDEISMRNSSLFERLAI